MSNTKPKSLVSLIDPLRRSERGSAMTEFVIGLPIFILIFSGLGMLYRFNKEAMSARMKTIQDLSTRTTAVNNFEDFVPNSGGSVNVGGFVDVNFPGSGSDGYLVDSGKKANIGSQFGELKSPADPPTSNIAGITGFTGSFANNLLDDSSRLPGSVSGWADIIRGVLNLTGTNVSIGAGMRYTPITAQQSHSFEHGWGNTTYNPGVVDLAAPTAATHRAFPVAVARLEMNRLNPYRSAMLEFNTSLEDSEMDISGGGLPAGANFSEEAAEECQSQTATYTTCIEAPESQDAADAMGSCGGVLGIGSHTCTVADVCESLEPDDSCFDGPSDSADTFENAFCNGQPNCARPNRHNRGDRYNSDRVNFPEFN